MEQFANHARSTLASGITSGATSMTVVSAAAFPAAAPFRCLIQAEGANTNEIVTVTTRIGAVFTISRATEPYAGSQVASAHAAGAGVAQVLTNGGLGQIIEDRRAAVAFYAEANTPGTTSPTPSTYTDVPFDTFYDADFNTIGSPPVEAQITYSGGLFSATQGGVWIVHALFNVSDNGNAGIVALTSPNLDVYFAILASGNPALPLSVEQAIFMRSASTFSLHQRSAGVSQTQITYAIMSVIFMTGLA